MERTDKIHFYLRTLKELREGTVLNFEDPEGILNVMNEDVRSAFLANPNNYADDEICQIIALDGNVVVGSVLSFANKYLADGKIRDCRGASTLFVSEKYRKLMIGADLMIQAATIIPGQDNIVAGISQVAYPIYKAMRYACFSMPRYIFLKKSRTVIESIFRSRNIFTRSVSLLFDIFLLIYRALLYLVICKKGFIMEMSKDVPDEVEMIFNEDNHKYKELHNKDWYIWNLQNSFNHNPRNRKNLYVIKKNGKIVAFYILKIEFFESISSRGFKDVTLATISEWGIKKGCNLSEYDLHLLAIKNSPKQVDGIQVATTDQLTSKKYRRSLFIPMGIANNAVLMTSIKDKDIRRIENWRLRIAAGDTLLN